MPRGDSNSQPRGCPTALCSWATGLPVNQFKYTLRKNEKIFFRKRGWICTIDLQGPFPWRSATELLSINIILSRHIKHLFKSTLSSRTRCKIDNLFTYKKTIIKMLISNEFRCRCRTWTDDLWLMRPTSYQLLQPAMYAAYLHRRAALFKLLNKLKSFWRRRRTRTPISRR